MELNVEQRCDRAQRLLEETAGRDPFHHSWGIFTRDDGPAWCSSGCGAFQWFADRDEALAHLCNETPLLYWSPDSEQEWQAFNDRLLAIAATQPEQPQAALAAFNEALHNKCQVEWIGPLLDLLCGDSLFALLLRADFHGDSDASAIADPHAYIAPTDYDRFTSFLRGYGD